MLGQSAATEPGCSQARYPSRWLHLVVSGFVSIGRNGDDRRCLEKAPIGKIGVNCFPCCVDENFRTH